jgi:hypothetical protein
MANRVMTDTGLERVEDVPYFLHNDPQVRGLLDVVQRELDRVEALIENIRLQWFPQFTITDSFLRMWEFNLGMPVAPPGLTDDQRALLIATHRGKPSVTTGADWVAALNESFGTGAWDYTEDYLPYTVRLIIPYGSSDITALGILAFARQITPAHVDLVVTYSTGAAGGFIVGVSAIGTGKI